MENVDLYREKWGNKGPVASQNVTPRGQLLNPHLSIDIVEINRFLRIDLFVIGRGTKQASE